MVTKSAEKRRKISSGIRMGPQMDPEKIDQDPKLKLGAFAFEEVFGSTRKGEIGQLVRGNPAELPIQTIRFGDVSIAD
jgi:hypothetical protein